MREVEQSFIIYNQQKAFFISQKDLNGFLQTIYSGGTGNNRALDFISHTIENYIAENGEGENTEGVYKAIIKYFIDRGWVFISIDKCQTE